MADDIKFNIRAEVTDAIKNLKGLSSALDETDKATQKTKKSTNEYNKAIQRSIKGLDGVYYTIDKYNRFAGKSQEVNGKLYKTVTGYNEALKKLRDSQKKHVEVQKEEIIVSESTREYIARLAKERERVDKLVAAGLAVRQDGTKKVVSSLKELEQKQKDVAVSAEKAGTQIRNSFSNAFKDVFNISNIASFTGFSTLAGGLQGMLVKLASTLKDAFAGAVDWQLQIQQAKQYGLEVKNTQELLAASSQLAVQFGTKGAQQVEALQKAAAVGYRNISEAYEIVEKANLLTLGSGATLAQGVETLTSALKTYNLTAADAGRITDALYAFTRSTNVSFQELSSAFSRGAQAASAFGVELEQVLAVSAVLARTGGKGNETFTNVRALVESITTPSEKSKTALEKFNAELVKFGKTQVAIGAEAVSKKGVVGVLIDIQNAAKGIGKTRAQIQDLVKRIVGLARASTPAATILNAGLKENDKMLKEITESAGKAAEGFKLIQESLSFQSKQKSNAFMTGLEEGFVPFTEALGKLLSKIDTDKIRQMATDISATFGLIISTIVTSVNTAIKTIEMLWDKAANTISFGIDYGINRVKYLKAMVMRDKEEMGQLNLQKEAIGIAYDKKSKKIWDEYVKDISETMTEFDKVTQRTVTAMTDPKTFKAEIKKTEEKKKKTQEILDVQKEVDKATEKINKKAEKEIESLKDQYGLLGKNAKQKKVLNALNKIGVDTTKIIVDKTGKITDGYETLTPKVKSMYEWLQKIQLKEDEVAKIEKARKDLANWSEYGGQRQSLLDFADDYKESMLSLSDVLTNAFNNVEDSIVDFCKTGKFSFSDMVDSMIEDLLRLMIQQQMAGWAEGISSMAKSFWGSSVATSASSASGSLFTSGAANGTQARLMAAMGMATGGFVSGAGTGKSDSVPAWLSNGEFVMNAQATAKYLPLLKQMNENKFAKGGLVGNSGKQNSNNDVNIQVIDQRGSGSAPIQTSQQQGPDGRKMIKMLVRDTVKQGFADGSYDSSMHSTYGIRRAAYQR